MHGCTVSIAYHYNTPKQTCTIHNMTLTRKFDGDSKSNIVLHLKLFTGPQKSSFLFMDRFDKLFSLTWKFDEDTKSDIALYLK